MAMLEAPPVRDMPLESIDLYAVSNGPGSFTGLRIGIGAVKGLAMGAQKPCIGISTLEALAQNLFGIQGIICAVMDARCNQVYTASFTMKCGELSRVTADEACSIDTLQKGLRGYIEPITLVGDGRRALLRKAEEAHPSHSDRRAGKPLAARSKRCRMRIPPRRRSDRCGGAYPFVLKIAAGRTGTSGKAAETGGTVKWKIAFFIPLPSAAITRALL